MDEFRDIESINAYREYTENGIIAPEDMMKYLNYKSRDNARTPMQWSDEENGGFTKGTPWIKINPNYTTINAKEQMEREDSVFHYYQKLISLRKKEPVIVYGTFALLMPEDEDIFMYTRTYEQEKLLVICNFSQKERELEIPEEWERGTILLGNYKDAAVGRKMRLREYEAIVIKK